jgi:hypothetical protein
MVVMCFGSLENYYQENNFYNILFDHVVAWTLVELRELISLMVIYCTSCNEQIEGNMIKIQVQT